MRTVGRKFSEQLLMCSFIRKRILMNVVCKSIQLGGNMKKKYKNKYIIYQF